MGFFLNRQSWRRGGGGMRAPHHNFVVIAPITMKFGTDVKLDVLHNGSKIIYDVTTITSL